jgi:hypothetical protein
MVVFRSEVQGLNANRIHRLLVATLLASRDAQWQGPSETHAGYLYCSYHMSATADR